MSGAPDPRESGERRRLMERLFDQARRLSPGEQTRFLTEACQHDSQLLDELSSLLAHAEGGVRFFRELSEIAFDSLDSLPTAVLHGDVDLPPGHMVGHYQILGPIGAGGMGTVFRAHDTRLNRHVALKFLTAPRGASGRVEEQLLVEARAAAPLEHANICTVHEVGRTDDGHPFLVMALYAGETLKERLRRGPLPPTEAVGTAIQISRGLQAAHDLGIVHRDVKPGNVMLTPNGTVKLLDFGVASGRDVVSTLTGQAPGTVAYMSPEQARGEPPDHRTDLWSLGVVLYEMVAGKRPFCGPSDQALIESILNEDPEPLGTVSAAPDSLSRIVDRLLRKDREARYQSAAEVAHDLETALSAGGPASRGRSVLHHRSSRAASAAAAAVVVLLGAALWLGGLAPEPPLGSREPGATAPSTVVLPVVNVGPAPEDDTLAHGLTRALVVALERTGELPVSVAASAVASEGSSLDLRAIAERVGASHLIQATLRRMGSRLHVEWRLVDSRDEDTLLSEAYRRELQDVDGFQADVARAVAEAVDALLAAQPAVRRTPRHTTNPAASEFYARGNDPAVLRSDSGARQGLEYFRKAVEADSSFAPAYAGLARMYLRLRDTADPGIPEHELHALAEDAALKSVMLDDSLAEAHAILGLLRWQFDHDLGAAESELRRAADLAPTQALIRQWLGQLYLQMGRPAQALAAARRAVELDPLSSSAHAEVAHALLVNGLYDEALAELESIEGVQPPLLRVPLYVAQCYAGKRMWAEALASLERAPPAGPVDARIRDPLHGHLLARAGRREEALRIYPTLLDRALQAARGAAFDMVMIEAGLGNLDEAFAWLERSVHDHPLNYGDLMKPTFAELRQDPRFEKFRRRLGSPIR